jgi:alpha-L-arabinofuranosidase
MASYAPLFAHVEGWQWTPNLIWTDNLRVHGTPNYCVQQLFSLNRGDVVLPVTLAGVELPAVPGGRIGLGTNQTAAEFKDVRVTRDGRTLLSSDFANGTPGWSVERGNWSIKDGAYQQADPKATGIALAGDASWSDYMLSLKARKLGGSEGFTIVVRYAGPENHVVWNIGGYRNKFHGIQARLAQQDHLVAQVPGSIETGRWYDVKVELKGSRLNCYLDGKLVQSADVPSLQVQCLYASAVRDEKSGEIILKVVNPGDDPRMTGIQLSGVAGVASEIKAIVLTGAGLGAENSFEHPLAVAPVESRFNVTGSRFDHRFPQHSMTVLRIKTR